MDNTDQPTLQIQLKPARGNQSRGTDIIITDIIMCILYRRLLDTTRASNND